MMDILARVTYLKHDGDTKKMKFEIVTNITRGTQHKWCTTFAKDHSSCSRGH